MTLKSSFRYLVRHGRRLLVGVLLLLASAIAAFGQSSATDGATPAGYTAGAPAGSYPLSGFDTVNFFNGNLNFNLPFLQLKGRGSSGHTLQLRIERKWRKMKVTNAPYAVGSGGWQVIQAGYGAGALEGRVAGMEIFCDGGWGALTLLRLTFTAPDGTEYELRDALTGGAAGWTEYDSSCVLQTTPSRGKVVRVVGKGARECKSACRGIYEAEGRAASSTDTSKRSGDRRCKGGGTLRSGALSGLALLSIFLDAANQAKDAKQLGYHFDYMGQMVIDDLAKAAQNLEQGTIIKFNGTFFKLKDDTFKSIDPNCPGCKLRQGEDGNLYIEGCKGCTED